MKRGGEVKSKSPHIFFAVLIIQHRVEAKMKGVDWINSFNFQWDGRKSSWIGCQPAYEELKKQGQSGAAYISVAQECKDNHEIFILIKNRFPSSIGKRLHVDAAELYEEKINNLEVNVQLELGDLQGQRYSLFFILWL